MEKREDNRQGYVLSYSKRGEFMAKMETEIWPIHLYDPAGSYSKPFPRFAGSARIEGNDDNSLFAYFLRDQRFNPCVMAIEYVKMLENNIIKRIGPKDKKLYLATVVRYCERGRPQIRVVTEEATDEVKERFGWERQPVIAKGDNDTERYRYVAALLKATQREEEPLVVAKPTSKGVTKSAEPDLEDCPF